MRREGPEGTLREWAEGEEGKDRRGLWMDGKEGGGEEAEEEEERGREIGKERGWKGGNN